MPQRHGEPTNQRIESKLRGFEGRCLRRILGIRWEHRVTNKEISERTGMRPILEEVKIRRWRWLGHVLRMSKSRHPLIALMWNPQGARKKGRPQGTWRRSVESKEWSQGRHGTSSIDLPRTGVNGGSLWVPYALKRTMDN
ncbi:hypothetical protein ElyMa_006192100 [Elysia marginata]|uniref:Transposase Tc1-like domain-containing protein n=1 Tax=Elysia marginata TaxID=1093978 RepID=A0AAV4H4V0_9GAST|nr:hypothetical protein ElyMa_006192100 [Elysia marginata]